MIQPSPVASSNGSSARFSFCKTATTTQLYPGLFHHCIPQHGSCPRSPSKVHGKKPWRPPHTCNPLFLLQVLPTGSQGIMINISTCWEIFLPCVSSMPAPHYSCKTCCCFALQSQYSCPWPSLMREHGNHGGVLLASTPRPLLAWRW